MRSIPDYIKMLIAYEDRRFFSHFGMDPLAMLRAGAQFIAMAGGLSRAARRSPCRSRG
jgi:membrane carboxypeptidase/penicillin-binding protein PbpC